MNESLKQKQDQWALAMAATHSDGPFKGRRVYETDPRYAASVTALGVEIAEAQKAEASKPKISQTQIDQLKWLDQLRGTTDANGKPLLLEMTARGTAFRKRVDAAHAAIDRGENIADVIAKSEGDIGAQKLALGAPAAAEARRLMPDASYQNPPGALPTTCDAVK